MKERFKDALPKSGSPEPWQRQQGGVATTRDSRFLAQFQLPSFRDKDSEDAADLRYDLQLPLICLAKLLNPARYGDMLFDI